MMLKFLDTFGEVAAEDDQLLRDYFYSTNAVKMIESGRKFLVLGRKGAGKTAIFQHISQSMEFSKALNLRSYPWMIHKKLKDERFEDINSYTSAWNYVLSVELAGLTLSIAKKHGFGKDFHASRIENFIQQNFGNSLPSISSIIQKQQLAFTKITIQPQILGNSIGSIDFAADERDRALGAKLDAVGEALNEHSINLLRMAPKKSVYLLFDELDHGLQEFHSAKKHMLVGLILAVRELKRKMAAENIRVFPVIFLRTDLWNKLAFSDKNKISESQCEIISWSTDSLLECINLRIREKLGSSFSWDNISDPALMRGSQKKWDHIVARTLKRPRDIIHYLNCSLERAKHRECDPASFCNDDIHEAKREYSVYFKNEFDDEIKPHWGEWAESLQACSTIAQETFDRKTFEEIYSRQKSIHNNIEKFEVLKTMFDFSIIGYLQPIARGGSSWIFKYNEPNMDWDNLCRRIKVHPGLKEVLRLREERASPFD